MLTEEENEIEEILFRGRISQLKDFLFTRFHKIKHTRAFEILCVRLDMAESGDRAFHEVEALCKRLGMKHKDPCISRLDVVLDFINTSAKSSANSAHNKPEAGESGNGK